VRLDQLIATQGPMVLFPAELSSSPNRFRPLDGLYFPVPPELETFLVPEGIERFG